MLFYNTDDLIDTCFVMLDKPLTSNRKAVLDVLLETQKALSAYDILDTLHALDTKWKPATVYRALNYLIEHNLIHRIESEQKFIRCDHDHHADEKHFLICNECGNVQELTISGDLLAVFAKNAKANHFQLDSPYLEFRGKCADCAH